MGDNYNIQTLRTLTYKDPTIYDVIDILIDITEDFEERIKKLEQNYEETRSNQK